ncbi:MAG: hydroxyethylthiazole kinase [Clostridia bacterium]|nr:hydroxyethylthiazole kinase [Clostridia bacterium]
MNVQELNKIRLKLRAENNLIHCITNPISINMCANGILAVGGRPIMAEHPKEVAQITKNAKALLLNFGNITDVRIKSMKISVKNAKENNIPVVIDLAGVSCSSLRRKLALEIISKYNPLVIKGNYSEIYSMYDCSYTTQGVDSEKLNSDEICKVSQKLSENYNCTVVATGKTDIITDKQKRVHIYNGTSALTQVTGTGCLLGALCSCFLSVENGMEALVCACGVLGICGELSENEEGTGTFSINLMNKLSTLSNEEFEKYLKMEGFTVESI